ncbi:hypothetical protein PO883_27215 [Massilia sp. DJPM01]|uniref:hypothetical protein n=1 Tax=Massilia sp. DJPM01 TaxID=3024404 RepID=UPI00259E0BC0|nr:hypothetical protein [Massilia sp. DJPM01]MDM5180876.1 hypothetical protein [Massilia sp. DJPM01]
MGALAISVCNGAQVIAALDSGSDDIAPLRLVHHFRLLPSACGKPAAKRRMVSSEIKDISDNSSRDNPVKFFIVFKRNPYS